MTSKSSLTVPWVDARLGARSQLSAILPELGSIDHPAVETLVTIVAIGHARLVYRSVPASVAAKVTAKPRIMRGQPGADIISLVETIVGDYARGATAPIILPLGDYVDDRDFVGLVIALVRTGASPSRIMTMSRIVAEAIQVLAARTATIAKQHLKAVCARDLAGVSENCSFPTATTRWLLAPELSGSPDRLEICKRRRQAGDLFASLIDVLRESQITAVIDEGRQLLPALMERLGLSGAELRSLRGAIPLAAANNTANLHFKTVVGELKVHGVPLHEWPGNGWPDRPDAWRRSVWLTNSGAHLLRPDYLGLPRQEATDAVKAFRDDILRPILADRAAVLLPEASPSMQIFDFLLEGRFPSSMTACDERRDFLIRLRQALVGSRGPKAFSEAVHLWHRRAASVAALRHEHQADKPGWPAMCPPWQSLDGGYAIVALVSAGDLVEEGNALHHCVGGYYETCWRGDTQILSLRRSGVHAATIELLLSGDDRSLSIQVGQFKSTGNRRPDDELHAVLKTFIAAIKNGQHPVDRKALIAHRKEMRRVFDGYGVSAALPLDHARQVFPLYRPLLPRGTPAGFDQWRAESGLDPVIDRAILAIAAKRSGLF